MDDVSRGAAELCGKISQRGLAASCKQVSTIERLCKLIVEDELEIGPC
jgi:hypothetical protein